MSQSYGFTAFVDCSKDEALFNQVHNEQLPTAFDAISERTGIESRSIAREEVTIQELTHAAIRSLFDRLNISSADCAGLVLSTCNSQQLSRGLSVTTSEIAVGHGITQSHGLNYACSGFPASVEAAMRMQNPDGKHIVIVCAEVLSRLVDWSDENTAILFGDGLVATSIVPGGKHEILEAHAKELDDPHHCLSFKCEANTQCFDGCIDLDERTVISMGKREGFQLYKTVPTSLVDLVANTSQGLGGTNRIVPHQANGKFIGKMAEILQDKTVNVPVYGTIANQANTASASIPTALSKTLEKNMFNRGDIVACPAKGAGIDFHDGKLTEGVVVFRVGE